MTVGNIAPVLNPPSEKVEAFPDAVLTVIADAFDISIEDLKGLVDEISWARQIGMYLMRQHTALSLPRIGEEFGKDHTTVLYSCDKIAQLQKSDSTLAQTLRQLSDRINLLARKIPDNQTQLTWTSSTTGIILITIKNY